MSFRQIPDGTAVSLAVEVSAGKEASSLQQVVEALYCEHYDALYRYLVLTGSSAADADEFVQEAFLRLLRELRHRECIRKPRQWLFRVTHNLRADWQRQSGRQMRIATEEVWRVGSSDLGPNPEAAMLLSERAERLRVAMAQLTARQSEILHLRAEGLKLREVAELLGISLQSVSEVCARAMDRIGRLVNE
jgi:RNA polymerase sigma-70 factor (ECF subfamily)